MLVIPMVLGVRPITRYRLYCLVMSKEEEIYLMYRKCAFNINALVRMGLVLVVL